MSDLDPALAFRHLDPHQILDSIDAAGWRTDGRVSALNSYENRVYSVGLEDGSSVVAKFYRPARWSDAAIAEEHAFCQRLVEHDLPVIAPLAGSDGQTLMQTGPFRFSLFQRAGGRPPELDNPGQLEVIGRTLARLHRVGEIHDFDHRPWIGPERLGDDSIDFLLDSDTLPVSLVPSYTSLVEELMEIIDECFEAAGDFDELCLHGDFHPGNILWGLDDTPHLLDFDDTGIGPAIQDLWMFVSGDREYAQARLGNLLDGYHQFRDFDLEELSLIEPLRTLRIIHYAAWIARRWEDPAFQQAFPFFASDRFWDDHILSLREQQSALDEPPLIY